MHESRRACKSFACVHACGSQESSSPAHCRSDYLTLQRDNGYEPPTHVRSPGRHTSGLLCCSTTTATADCRPHLMMAFIRPGLQVDIFGSGEDLPAIQAEYAALELDVTFHGPTDHAGRLLHEYKVFINPSQSEVLSTTTAEALAMGKYVVIERHPSNAFFAPFRNALLCTMPEGTSNRAPSAMRSLQTSIETAASPPLLTPSSVRCRPRSQTTRPASSCCSCATRSRRRPRRSRPRSDDACLGRVPPTASSTLSLTRRRARRSHH